MFPDSTALPLTESRRICLFDLIVLGIGQVIGHCRRPSRPQPFVKKRHFGFGDDVLPHATIQQCIVVELSDNIDLAMC